MIKVIDIIAVDSNSFVLDISRYAPAAYTAKINANNYLYVGEIIKK